MIRRILLCALALVAGVALAALPASSGSAATRASAAASKPAKLTVAVRVGHIHVKGRMTKATGTATAALTNFSGATTKVEQKVTLSATNGGSCKVLHLFLDRLDLTLLGLNAHLDKVTLDITGKSKGGVLGQLFCRLSKGLRSRAAAAKAINARMAGPPMRAFRFSTRVTPQATASQAAPTCQVLDLVLGPLNLDLLGLVVDLKRVHLSVTATRGGGVLGDLFCKLADENTTTTTSTAPPPTTG